MADTPSRPASRPLSELSENDDLRRVSARVSSYSSTLSLKGERISSRPGSQVGGGDDTKRVSLPVHTITLNLADYTGSTATTTASKAVATCPPVTVAVPGPAVAQATAASTVPTASSSSAVIASASIAAGPTSPVTKRKSEPPAKPEKPAELTSPQLVTPPSAEDEEHIVDLSSEPSDGVSPLLVATRAALRRAPLGGATTNDQVQVEELKDDKVSPSPPASTASNSFDSPRSSIDMAKPYPKSKPSWLKRASMAPALRSISRSPASTTVDLPVVEPASPHFATTPVPPPLPPRKFPSGPLDATSAPGPSRTHAPPSHPTRGESMSHSHSMSTSLSGRSRWAWGGPGMAVQRSTSSNSIGSTTSASQRLPSSASRVLGHSVNAMSKTWNRARGVGGSMSISGLGSLGAVRAMEPDFTGGSTLGSRMSRDNEPAPYVEPAVWDEGVIKRRPRVGYPKGLVFGRAIDTVGRTWGVYDAADDREGESEYDQRRRRCLPAVVVRCVDYLTTWGPKEEGIFRVSGRASHLQKLRREFDAGADMDLTLCEAADLDPHAIAGTFKSYIRELADPMLPTAVEAKLDTYLHRRTTGAQENVDELVAMIAELPSANWFLLADVIGLIDLIPRHADLNRMSHNALMISLGPTLRLSGEVVALLLRHREALFANPPMVSAEDLVNFGSEELLTLSPTYESLALPSLTVAKAPVATLAPRLSKKNSFSNLLGGSRSSMRRSQSAQVLSVSPVPPRIALPETTHVDLPKFRATEDIAEGDEMESIETAEPVAKASDKMEDAQYAPGTVASRARVFSTSTPIADRFRRGSVASSVGIKHDSSLSSSPSSDSSLSGIDGHPVELPPPPNPRGGLRRSPPIFFQSKNSSVVSSDSTDDVVAAGMKRKDDPSRVRDPDGAPGGAKRLSSGPSLDEDVLIN